MASAEPNARLRWLGATGLPLGVLCGHCLHRALIHYADLTARHGIMRKIADLRFVCTRCGSRDFSVQWFQRRPEIVRFMRPD